MPASSTVDYAPLLTKPTPQEVAEFKARAKLSGAPWANVSLGRVAAPLLVTVLATVIAAPIVTGIVVSVLEGLEGRGPVSGIFALFALLALALVIVVIIWAVASRAGRWPRWTVLDRFARANGFVFSPEDANPSYPGAIFGVGDSRVALEHFRTAEGRFLDFGNYRYSTGSGKSRATHSWGFLALKLDRRLPHMVLDSLANNGLFGGTNLPAVFDKDQILSLEGDFDRYFRLYCPKQYERDALYVFTPDLMALLIDEAAPFDVEIIDDWMFVYSKDPFRAGDPVVYQRLLRIVETVGAKTLTQTDRYQDDRAAAPFVANIVAPQGTRLKRGVSVGAILMVVAALAIWGWSVFGDILSSLSGG